MKKLGNAATIGLALCTAYGLGIISCVAYEVKLFAELCESTKKEVRPQYRAPENWRKERETR